jgi:hypothetical protein
MKLCNEIMMEASKAQRVKLKTAITHHGAMHSIEAYSSTCININHQQNNLQ